LLCYGAAGAGGGGGNPFFGAQPAHNTVKIAASNTKLVNFFFIVMCIFTYK
jgi:hypothetical protein